MAYLLGKKACMESLSTDVQDIHWTIREIISRVGPLDMKSWKFPDQIASNVDIEDLLDLYSYDDDDEDAEEMQVAHIALYELVIDRLLLLVQATAKFAEMNLGGCSVASQMDGGLSNMAGSVGVAVKQFWLQISRLQTLYNQLQSENKSKESKVHLLEKELGILPSKEPTGSPSKSSSSLLNGSYSPMPKTPGTLGLIPPNNADLILMGLASPSEKDLSIARDTNNKACQTFETCLVPCESCEFVQRKMREAGDVVIKVCADQGLPSSLKKFKSEVAHVEALRFNDTCRWMAEQNKDIARIGKQTELLQASIDPLKKEVKNCGRKVREAEDNAKTYEDRMKEEKQTQAVLRKQIETKMKDQEKHHKGLMDEESRQKSELRREKEKLEQEVKDVKQELSGQIENLKALELEYKVLDNELKEKSKVALKAEELQREVSTLKVNLADVQGQLEGTTQALAREKGKGRSASSHNESLQAKQESLLARMERLGQENEDLAQQVASLEEGKGSYEDKVAELKVEMKALRKKVRHNEVIIQNLESEKKEMAEKIKDSEEAISQMESRLEEAKERERMIVEYPDLNGPVNPDLNGTGDIVTDMKNQVKANTIRMRLLEEQNSGLSQSIRKLAALQPLVESGCSKHEPIQPTPLWQQDSLYQGDYNNSNLDRDSTTHLHQLTDKIYNNNSPPPKVKQHAWTFESSVGLASTRSPPQSGRTGRQTLPDPAQEFVVGHSNSRSASSGRRPPSSSSGKQGRPSSAKMRTVNAPINATPIGAYTQMKQALGILSGMDKPRKARPSSGKANNSGKPPISERRPASDFHIGVSSGGVGSDPSTPFSCPHCDKMYIKGRDLDIHLSYCTHVT